MNRQYYWFAVIGVAAMATHFLLVSLLLVPLGMAPLLANVLAYLLAFQISYWGHRRKTFEADHLAHSQTLPRFFAVSCLSFLANEALYFALLHYTALDYRIALIVVLIAVAAITFILSKTWAFQESEST